MAVEVFWEGAVPWPGPDLKRSEALSCDRLNLENERQPVHHQLEPVDGPK